MFSPPKKPFPGVAITALFLLVEPAHSASPWPPNPWPRPILSERAVAAWEFRDNLQGWTIEKHARTISVADSWTLDSLGIDPILISPPVAAEQRATVRLRMKMDAPGPGQIFWMTPAFPHASEDRRTQFNTNSDGKWHEYTIECPFDFEVSRFRVDPATGPGRVEIDWIRIEQRRLHPLEIASLTVTPGSAQALIRNHSKASLQFRHQGRAHVLGPGSSLEIRQPRPANGRPAFERVQVRLESEGLPPVERAVVVHNPEAPADWQRLRGERLTVDVAPDGSGARLLRDKQPVGVIAPLLWDRNAVPNLTPVGAPTSSAITFRGESVRHLKLSIVADELRIVFRGERELEGPVVRVFGGLEQGLLPGVEHLGKGERSSSDLDLHGPERVRHTPPLDHVTMPMMAFVTDRASVAMLWWGARPQPVFTAPNFFENTPDHRMALTGTNWNAIVRVKGSFTEGERLADAVRWGVKKSGGLPKVQSAPRSPEAQFALCLRGMNGPELKGDNGGWFHALVPGNRYSPEKPRFFADHLSTMYRLTGKVPDFPEIVPGGAHIDNDAIYFLTGRADEWLQRDKRMTQNLIVAQRPDGSYRYGGKYREGHFEDTSSGQCARPAWLLLLRAKRTGDESALRAGVKTLEFMKRFRTPRGAQVWECPLHAPDILAAAHLVRAYTLGYELTGNEEYLKLATRWALNGVPFVYQWGDRPIMQYATIATICATHWKAPVWIGRPVQWCGIVYADALLDLAPHDTTLDWRRLAEGILVSGEQQQYTEGGSAGLLADSLILKSQKLLPFDINPCALVSLRLRLNNAPAGLETTVSQTRRVVAPFPVAIEGETAAISARKGVRYQVVIDGQRVVEILSQGIDKLPLDPPAGGL